MKSWARVGLILGLLGAASFASLQAWPTDPENSEYGTCQVFCQGQQVSAWTSTAQECCTSPQLCPDGSRPAFTWSPDQGWPYFCPPYET